MNKKENYFILVTALLLLVSCTGSKKMMQQIYQPASQVEKGLAPDYSNHKYWSAHPAKKDPSDSTPLPYRNFTPDSTVDIFFIHPTTYTGNAFLNEQLLAESTEQIKWNASVNDSALNYKTDYTSILFQASAFNRYRVFAPRYRQAHVRAFYINDTLSAPIFDTAYADIEKAFNHYLENENQGRPFIIASHSQGTLHAGRLIRQHIENSALVKRMVAAYIIGLPVPENYFSHCLPCSTASQTGCIISWRTYKEGYESPRIQNEKFKAWVVNPLTWTMDTLPASKKLNSGAILFKFNKPISRAVSATIHGNILWASKPHFFGSLFFKRNNFHIGDINLYWKNIRDNVETRVKAYKENNQEMTSKSSKDPAP